MSAAEVRERIAELTRSAWISAAVAAAVEVGLPRYLSDPGDPERLAALTGLSVPLVTVLAEALCAAGLASRQDHAFVAAPGLAEVWGGGGGEFIQADLRATLLQTAALLEDAIECCPQAGWAHTDERVLQAQGTLSASSIEAVDQLLLPMLDGLTARLDSGHGVLLDVGTGVGAVAIALCQRHPHLRAVSIEPQTVPVTLARHNIQTAGLADRIEVRQQLGQDLKDTDAFDLAWLAGDFLAPSVLPAVLDAVHRALTPGGWLITGCVGGGEDSPRATAARLRAVLWGGDTADPTEVGALLRLHGFETVQLLPRRSSDLVPIIARRP
ncbi:MAG: SAM-dependent methyltransferase [Solirubrobacteraceae bacterium]